MTNFIPIFPLEIVAFPGQQLNLHIFEPRYKQLVNECAEKKKPFGIPVIIENRIAEFGTTMYIKEIVKTYENGEMDIITEGHQVFRVLEVINTIPDKLYSGAIVNYLPNSFLGNPVMMKTLLQKMREFHLHLNVTREMSKNDGELNVFDIAHYSGLNLQQEYELLQLTDERQRQEYLKRHFETALPLAYEMSAAKEKIQMNGHFRHLSSMFNI